MFDKAKAVLLATALATTSVVSLSPRANANYTGLSRFEVAYSRGYSNWWNTQSEGDTACRNNRYQYEGIWNDGSAVVNAYGTYYRVSKIVNTWYHKNNNRCMITVVQ
jgi:hypothetical protein